MGDSLPQKMAYLKEQKDGKEIDHLYKDQQLIFADEKQKIWFIGDSKYYSDKNDISRESLYKQYTYARNVIQYSIDDLLRGGESLRYRDSLTEGYSITPNFFVRGNVEKSDPCNIPSVANVVSDPVENEKMWQIRNRHFGNRLFDRDTLLLQVYNVNFLYVLKAFTAKNSSLREEFKKAAREKFRSNFLTLLRNRYYFWYIKPNETQEEFVNAHYRTLQGKLFRSGNDKGLVLALEQAFVDENNDKFLALRNEIKNDCEVINVDPALIWDEAVTKGEKGLKRPSNL